MRNKGTPGHDSPLSDVFSDRLVSLMGNRTAASIAKEMNVTPQQFSKWIQGTVPRADALCMIADYFQVSVDYLLGRAAAPTDDKPFTTAGEVVDVLRRVHNSVESRVFTQKVNEFEYYEKLYPDGPNYSDPDDEIDLVTIQISNYAVVRYITKAMAINRLAGDDDCVEEARKLMIAKYKAEADATPLHIDEQKGE